MAAPAPVADPTWSRLAPAGFAAYVRVDHFTAAEPSLAGYADDRLSLEGWLPPVVLARVLGALGPMAEGRAHAAVWEGFGGLPPWLAGAPRWCAAGLCHHCVELDLARVASFALGPFTHSATIWWPVGGGLCAVTPLDVPATVLATDDPALVARVAALPDLDVEVLAPA
jgi:hypothetical protein